MRNFFYFLVSISFLISCNNTKKYEGEWTNFFLTDYGYNESRNVVISNDSIEFNYPYFDYYNKYSLNIENNTFTFNNSIFKASIKKDTLTLNDSLHFVRDNLDTLNGYKPILKIDLPHISKLQTSNTNDYYTSYLYFGKRLDNDQFSLQLNDKYADLRDLHAFIGGCSGVGGARHRNFPIAVLFIDKDTPLKYMEHFFHELKKINQLKISLASNIVLKYEDSLGLFYNYETLNRLLPYYRDNDNYVPTTSSDIPQSPPPPPPTYCPMFDDENLDSKFIYLKNDQLYFENKVITTSKLKTLIKPWVKNNKVIFSLYDLESTYGKFLEMNAIINLAYENIRNENAKTKFNKSLNNLTREEFTEIKIQTPMHHIWSYSIPHYNDVVKQEKTFFGLKVNKKV